MLRYEESRKRALRERTLVPDDFRIFERTLRNFLPRFPVSTFLEKWQ